MNVTDMITFLENNFLGDEILKRFDNDGNLVPIELSDFSAITKKGVIDTCVIEFGYKG